MGSLCFKGLYYPIIDASLKPIRDREIFSFKSYLILVLELSISVTALQCMIRSVVRCSKLTRRLFKIKAKRKGANTTFSFQRSATFNIIVLIL